MSDELKVGAVYSHSNFLDVVFRVITRYDDYDYYILWLTNKRPHRIIAYDLVHIPLDKVQEYYKL